jgi:hypothetical protein
MLKLDFRTTDASPAALPARQGIATSGKKDPRAAVISIIYVDLFVYNKCM